MPSVSVRRGYSKDGTGSEERNGKRPDCVYTVDRFGFTRLMSATPSPGARANATEDDSWHSTIARWESRPS